MHFKIIIKCMHCGDRIEVHRDNDMAECTCGACSIQGKEICGIDNKDYTHIRWDTIGEE